MKEKFMYPHNIVKELLELKQKKEDPAEIQILVSAIECISDLYFDKKDLQDEYNELYARLK